MRSLALQSAGEIRNLTITLMMKLVALTLVASACVASAQDWTRFRGPNGSGVSATKTIPAQWTEKDFRWKQALPGTGHSSPVLWGEKVFVTSCEERSGQFQVLCLNANDGRQLWRKEFPLTTFRKNNLNTFASSTPTVDAERVYVCRTDSAQISLLALDHRGEVTWQRQLGPFKAQHGSGTSPILHDGLVVLANEQDGDSFIVALDARTGETRWQTPREPTEAAYSTPCVFQPKTGRPELVFASGSHGLYALASDTGKVLWDFPAAFDKRSVSSPLIAGELILGSCGSGGGGNYVIAVRPGIAGGTPAGRVYEVRKSAPYVPTSVCVGEWLYLWSDGGIVSRVHAASGEVKWQERVGGNYFGSPVWVDGRLFCVSRNGEVVVVAAGEKFELLARNPLGETTHSTPAVAGGRMFIHTSGHLYCVGGNPVVE